MGYKIHLACDGEAEMPLGFRVAPVNKNDKKHAVSLLKETAEMVRAEVVVCDKQYSSRKIRKFIVDQGAETVIPYPKSEERRQRHLRGRIEVQGSRP